jgi:hypothetical protein
MHFQNASILVRTLRLAHGHRKTKARARKVPHLPVATKVRVKTLSLVARKASAKEVAHLPIATNALYSTKPKSLRNYQAFNIVRKVSVDDAWIACREELACLFIF